MRWNCTCLLAKMDVIWTRLHSVCILVTWLCLMETRCDVVPTVTLTSCLHNTATVTIENAWNGGIIYFRTDTAYNMIVSNNGTIIHECVFEDCNIEWDTKIYVIVQRKMLVQTYHDVIIWFVCSTDFESGQPVLINFGEMLDDNLTTAVYKPDVSMSMFVDTLLLENQEEVMLGTEITMVIEITNDPDDYFDISPKSCFASGITLYEDSCPVAEDLLGEFNTSLVGYTFVTFGMFRPTSIVVGAVEVVFTCIVEVCDEICEEADCTNSTNTSSNSSSSDRRRRDVSRNSNPSVIRGFTLMVVTEGDEIINQDTQSGEKVCLTMYAVIVLLGTFFLVLFMAITVTGYNYQRSLLMKEEINVYQQRQTENQKLDKGVGDFVNKNANNQRGSNTLNKFKQPNKGMDNMAVKKDAGTPDVTYTPSVTSSDMFRDRSNTWSEVRGVSSDTGLSALARHSHSTYRRKSCCKSSN